MAASKDSFRSWRAALRAQGFQASEHRLNCICTFLLTNDFECIEDLRGARHPQVWEDAAKLLPCTSVEFHKFMLVVDEDRRARIRSHPDSHEETES